MQRFLSLFFSFFFFYSSYAAVLRARNSRDRYNSTRMFARWASRDCELSRPARSFSTSVFKNTRENYPESFIPAVMSQLRDKLFHRTRKILIVDSVHLTNKNAILLSSIHSDIAGITNRESLCICTIAKNKNNKTSRKNIVNKLKIRESVARETNTKYIRNSFDRSSKLKTTKCRLNVFIS